ncbi:hypothetical protein IQ266_25290 [filamentous cyanobacterium LEGE 11480]|uniref:Uncharacterized protein n=1 Tax=Romeriopsis navalis LEGE 11480 TaxID=2777977 RepID=A0A928VU17_9CYAN|nr:hypothetical protein [Romeriopsis navalis]MBE9033056.1 hypothetical protein [Romeriopsis navalis LEGE 11480]
MKRLLSYLGKIMGIPLTAIGGLNTGICVLSIILAKIAGGWLVLTLFLLILFGLIPLGLGIASLYASSKMAQAAIRDHFYKMLRRNTGRISLTGFSTEARLDPSQARQYLDAWARECDAQFDVTDDGDIYYIFSTQPQRLPFSQSKPFQIMERMMEKWVV